MARKNPAAVALGRRKSLAKSAASRRNGKRGGRPLLARPCIKCGSETTCRNRGGRPACGCA